MNLEKFLQSSEDGVFYVGHASILIRMSGKYILCDPAGLCQESFYYSWFYYPEQILSEKILDVVDYVIVSHIHKDHLDPIFLRKLRPKTKLLVFDIQTLKNDLNRLNIDYDVIDDEIWNIDENISIKGFVNHRNKVDSSSLIYNHDFCVYHGNDNWADIDEIKSRFDRKINVACVPFAFVYWYPYLFRNMEKSKISAESERLINEHFDYAVRFIKSLDVDLMIPFGSNLIHDSSAFSDINMAVKNPLEFKQFIESQYNDISDKVFPLFADDYVMVSGPGKYNIVQQKRSFENYRHEVDQYVSLNRNNPNKEKYYSNFSEMPINKFKSLITDRIKNIPHADSELYVVSADRSKVLHVDFRGQKFNVLKSLDKKVYEKENLTHVFELDKKGSKLYFSGKVFFEDILGSRFFTVYRNSDYHCRTTFSFLCNL